MFDLRLISRTVRSRIKKMNVALKQYHSLIASDSSFVSFLSVNVFIPRPLTRVTKYRH